MLEHAGERGIPSALDGQTPTLLAGCGPLGEEVGPVDGAGAAVVYLAVTTALLLVGLLELLA